MPGGGLMDVGGERAFRCWICPICRRNVSSSDDVLLAGDGLFECNANCSVLSFGAGVRTPAIVPIEVDVDGIVGTKVIVLFVVGDVDADDADGNGESETGFNL